MRCFMLVVCFAASVACAVFAAEDAILVYSHPVNAGPLDPHGYLPNQMYAQEMVYEPLVRTGADGEILPCLAESWEVGGDGLAYTFTLRPGVLFSDGEPFTADAVVRNFDRILANRARHSWLELANKIDSYSAPDERTFRLVLSSPHAPALADLSLPRPFRFLSPAAFDSGKPVGTGVWQLAESAPGEYDRFVRNEKHWGAPSSPGAPEEVLVKIIPDPVTRALALRTGEIDLVMGSAQIDYDSFAVLQANPEFATATSSPMGTLAAALNTARGATRDPAVRRALQHMADKDAIVRGIFQDTQPRADFLFAPGVPYCDAGLAPYAYAPEEARALLDAAGWVPGGGESVRSKDGEPLEIDFCFIGGDAAQKAVAEVLQAQAAAVGIRLNLLGEEEDAHARRQLSGEFGMIMLPLWGPPFEPHAALASMRSPSHADYQAQSGLAAKPAIDADITRALQTTDDAERARLYSDVLRTLHEQAVYLPIHHVALLAAYRPDRLANVHFGGAQTEFPFEDFTLIKRGD